MDQIINYLTECIKPRSSTEFAIATNFDKDIFDSMIQDSILIIKSNDQIDRSIDHVTIATYTLIRKNIPREIAWLSDDPNKRFEFDLTNGPIYRRLVPPPYETVNHPFIIKNIIKEISSDNYNKTYIEYGVRNGDSIEQIAPYVAKAHGVDTASYIPKCANIQMYKMLTDEFSNQILPGISFDYAFIDADHSSRQVLIDFENIYKCINPGGYIFLHDTYPCMEKMLQPDYCNDCYLSPILIRNKYPEITQILTLPLNPGLTIIRK